MVTQSQNDGPASGGSISFSQVVELSWPAKPGIPRWPGDPDVEFQTVAAIEQDGYFLRRFSMGEHSGTHFSAPSGFLSGAPGQEDYSPDDLVRQAIAIDVSGQAATNPDYALTVNDVLNWESDHGSVPQGSLVLLHTGWQTKWSSPSDYLGGAASDRLHFPGFGLESAEVLLNGRGVAGLGIDTAGAEPGSDTSFSVSRLALKSRLIVLENLRNLDLLPATGTLVVIGLLRLEGGSGCPASVTALVP